jgi:metallo-beta-lactamase family protein
VFASAKGSGGNIIIPAFAVGRTQDLLYLLAEHYDDWDIGSWRVFLDSPMAIEATEAYSRYRHLYHAHLFRPGRDQTLLPNLVLARSAKDSMAINALESGALVIAASGMCTGGRVLHHLKHNVWRPECHVVIVGYQARGTLGRRLVDGADYVKIYGETIRANATVHTVGGLSAHADQSGLLDWYGAFAGAPPVALVHGEPDAQTELARKLRERFDASVTIPAFGDRIDLLHSAGR